MSGIVLLDPDPQQPGRRQQGRSHIVTHWGHSSRLLEGRKGEGKGGWLVGGWGCSAVSLQSVSGGDGGREGREGGPGGRAAPAPHTT